MADKRYPMLSFRVSHEEKRKAKALAHEIKKSLPQLTESDVFRELMGFTSTGLVTAEMRRRLLSNTDLPVVSAETVITAREPEEKIRPRRAGIDQGQARFQGKAKHK